MADPAVGPRIIVALDLADPQAALDLSSRLDPAQCRVKVGKELFTRAGPDLVRRLVGEGFEVFLDLKFHDIPHTVARACTAAAELGVWMLNVHAFGGRRMMEAAREAVSQAATPPLLVAVTVLTSLTDSDLSEVGLSGSTLDNVTRLARLADTAGLDGVVCSPQELGALRETLGTEPALVTPGVRPAGSAPDDQSRTLTPAAAIAAGANYLVVGRPVTAAPDPLAALAAIQAELARVGP